MDLKLTKNCSLTVTLKHFIKFTVIKHTKKWKRLRDEQDYLGFYTLDSHHVSASVHGLLGQQQLFHVFMLLFLTFNKSKDIKQAILVQVSFTMGLSLRWQTCVQVTSRRN